MMAETGMYMINTANTDTAVVEFEQLNSSIEWEVKQSYTEITNRVYRIRGFLTEGVITSVDWKTTGFQDAGQGYLATDYYYSEPYMPTEDYQPATKKYVDDAIASIDFANILTQNNTVDYTPVSDNDVTTKSYVDQAVKTAVEDQLKATY